MVSLMIATTLIFYTDINDLCSFIVSETEPNYKATFQISNLSVNLLQVPGRFYEITGIYFHQKYLKNNSSQETQF